MPKKSQFITILSYFLVLAVLLGLLSFGASLRRDRQNVSGTSTANYFVSPSGSDSNAGTEVSPWRTIGRAITAASGDSSIGANIYIGAGTYREYVNINGLYGNSDNYISLIAKDGPNTAFVVGSQTSQNLTWTQSTDGLPFPDSAAANIYVANASSFGAKPEIAVLASSNYGSLTRLRQANEPDHDIYASTESVDNRFTATGGSLASLSDTSSDGGGDLTNINGFTSSFLTGARLYAKDTYSGHDDKFAIVTSHNAAGSINLDRDLKYYTGQTLIGAQTKYYLEGKAEFLDTAGEWYYDQSTQKIYMWSPNSASPDSVNIEFAIRPIGIAIRNSKYVKLKDLNVYFTNHTFTDNTGEEGAVLLRNTQSQASENIVLSGLNIQHAGVGVRFEQSTTSGNLTRKITLENSKVLYTDGYNLNTFHWPYKSGSNFVPGVQELTIINNEFGYGGFKPHALQILFEQSQKIIFQNNFVHHSAHNMVQFTGGYDSYSLVTNNLFENACLTSTDCGALKFWAGNSSQGKILVTNNIARNTLGCSYAAKTNDWVRTSRGQGCFGVGFYTDATIPTYATGPSVIFYRNVSLGHKYAGFNYTKSKQVYTLDNFISNNPYGINVSWEESGGKYISGGQIKNNLFYNSNNSSAVFEPYGYVDYAINFTLPPSLRDNVIIDRNAYRQVGASSYNFFTQDSTWRHYKTVGEIRVGTPWEDNGNDMPSGSYTDGGGQSFNLAEIFQSFGTSIATIPAEVSTMSTELQNALGIAVNVSDIVGKHAGAAGNNPPPEPPPAGCDTNLPTPTSVYRFWSNKKQAHFYTTSECEKESVQLNHSSYWTYERVAYKAILPSGETCVSGSPVYRFWSDRLGKHFYTIDAGEKQFVIDNLGATWRYERVAFCAHTSQVANTSPVYRFWSDRLQGHFYTISGDEKTNVENSFGDTWRYENIGYFAYP